MADEFITQGPDSLPQVRRAERGWTAKRREAFLSVLAASANVRLAARSLGIDPAGAYRLRARDKTFAALWAEAMALGYETLEQALIERARGGVNAIAIDGLAFGLTLTGEVDGDVHAPPPATINGGQVEMDVKLAMWLLDRQDRRGGRTTGGVQGPAPTRETVEAKIARKLDMLAKRRKR
ncbi:hypothetical protein COC42_10665 [Sphingomonas spermidinifaciens]|uniref:Terminase n=1 Tax=Sphingomonas spermidinifaciens TaxID=1141889 RepID=A0A2A4B2U8_9SPHN|nr:hypothetical protein [Sphingomonas spermidinifaciens]PCD01956.1 hypothetical protein COC42_10665 [Sphingomonas spermidinifaciens]